MKPLHGALLSLGLLTACDVGDEASVCEPVDLRPRRLASNAFSLNGMNLNAMNLNGIALKGMTLDGTTLVGVDAGGVERPVDPVGARLEARTDTGEIVELSIDAIAPDPERPDITYYAVSLHGDNVCGPDGRGLFVTGTWDDSGARHDVAPDGFSSTFSCTNGVIAKCVLWGYTPYDVDPDAHQTCTRLARADYCGDGIAYTRDGTEIDVFDALGVLRSDDDAADMRFEAGWGPDGAVCVDAPRYEMISPDGDTVLPPCWDALPRCASETEAQRHAALLANRSHGELRNVCDPPAALRKRPGRSK